MFRQRKWLLFIGAVVAAAIALTLGVPANTLLAVGALLLCPTIMLFGMHGMGTQHESGASGHCCQRGAHGNGRKSKNDEQTIAQGK